MQEFVIDCDRCTARGLGCQDCVVSCLLGDDRSVLPLEPIERDALGALAQAGLVPPLRMDLGNRLKVV